MIRLQYKSGHFLERVFVRRFPVKQMLIIGMCGYEKSDICMFPSF